MPSSKDLYQKNGFVIVKNVFNYAETEALLIESENVALSVTYSQGCLNGKGVPAKDLKDILCIHQPHSMSSLFMDYIKSKSLTDILYEIIGPSVKCMQSMMFVKAPGLPGQAWHQDEFYIPTRDRSLCGAWIALDDATVENGCLWVMPGSQKSGYIYPMKKHNKLDQFDYSNEAYGFDETPEIPVELKKGDVVFFNGYLLHRSKKNNSKDSFRRALVFHYMNSYSLLPWGKSINDDLENGASGNKDNRKVVQVLGIDPYEHKGYESSSNDEVYIRSYQKV